MLYPMNALANDQAGRFAKQVLDVSAYLKSGIREGLYTGYDDNAAKSGRHSEMGYVDEKRDKAHAIDDHDAMKANPPDNAHVFRTPETDKHLANPGVWTAPFALADDYHVYALEWSAKAIKWYVDGKMIRELENTATFTRRWKWFWLRQKQGPACNT